MRSSARAGAAYCDTRSVPALSPSSAPHPVMLSSYVQVKNGSRLRIGCRRAVVEHRIDQHLLGDRRAAAVTCHQAHAGRQTAARAVAHHRYPGGIGAERGCVLGEPAQCGVAVLDGRGVRMLGRDSVVDDEHRHAGVRDVVAHRDVVHRTDVLEAEDHASAVQIQNGAARGRRQVVPAGVEQCAVGGGHRVALDQHAWRRCAFGGHVVEHPVAVDSSRLHVADRWLLDFADGRQKWGKFREHLRVDRQCHNPTVTWARVTMAQLDTAAGRHIAPFAAGVVLPIAGVVALLHCAASAFGGYWFDEVYMLAIGRYHLEWGSADQPPMAPALAALMDAIAPGSLVALRLPAVLATAGAVVVAGLIARELGCDRRAQGLTAAAQATALWTTLAGHWLTPYTLEPVQWLLLIWLLVRWVRLRDDRLLLVLGVVAGVAALTKFQVLLLCLVLVVAVAAVGPRALLRRPLLWVGAGIGAALAAPTLVWQYMHDWPQLRMAPVVAGEAEALYGGRSGIAVQLIVFARCRRCRADELWPVAAVPPR